MGHLLGRVGVVLCLLGGFVLPGAVLAQDEEEAQIADDPNLENEARNLFEAGRTAYESARYEAALRYFQQAHEIVNRPAMFFNIGAAADRLQRSELALQSYRAYLEAIPEAPNRAFVLRRIEFLEGILEARQSETQTAGPVADPGEAAATVVATTPAEGPTDSGTGGGDVTSEWWFWTVIAAVVIGAGVGVTLGVVLTSGQIEEPLPGDFPAVMALRVE